MIRVMVVLADGFEEIEALTVVDILRRAGIETVTVALKEGPVLSVRGVKVLSDTLLEVAVQEEWDGVILPGGQPGANHLKEDQRVLNFLKKMDKKGKLIGAICAAPIVLAAAGILKNRKATSYPGYEVALKDALCQTGGVVIDGNIITSRGPATAADFAFALAEILAGKEKAQNIRKDMLFEEPPWKG